MRQARHRLSGSVRQRMCPHRRVYAPSPRMFCDAGHPDAHDLDNGLIRGMTHPIGRITSLPNTCARWPPTPPPEGGKKDRARHVFRQHGFHAGPRASLPAFSLCVPSRSLNLDGWGGIGCGLSRGAGGQAKRSGQGEPKCLAAHRFHQREGRRIARDMYSANMVSTLVRGHPCPHSPCVSHRVPSIWTDGVAV